MKKGIIKLITILLVLALPAILLTGCQMQQQQSDYAQAYVYLKINPEVELAVNSEGKVEAVYYANEDAEILLSQTDLIGMDIEDAVEKIVDEATEAGYIDVEGTENEVEVGIITDEDEDNAPIEERLRNRLRERIHKYFDNNGIFGVVSQATLEQYAEQAAQLGVSLGKTKMILRALELDPLLDINDLKEMPMNELARGLANSVKKGADISATLREEFITEREAILSEYPEFETLKQDILSMRGQLNNFEGTEEERLELENALGEKQQQLDALKEVLASRLEELREEYKTQCEQIRVQQREQVQQMKEANKKKVQERRANVSQERVQQIQQWRKNKK